MDVLGEKNNTPPQPQEQTMNIAKIQVQIFIAQIQMLPDFRKNRGKRYSLAYLLLIIFFTELAGLKRHSARIIWIVKHKTFICNEAMMLGIETPWEGDVPSKSTLSRFVANIDYWALMQQHLQNLRDVLFRAAVDVQDDFSHFQFETKLVCSDSKNNLLPHYAVDGKARAGITSSETGRTESDLTIMEVDTRTVIAKHHLPDKKGESTIFRHLIATLGKKITPGVFTFDAGITCPKVLSTLRNTGHSYIGAIKTNAGTAYDICANYDWESIATVCKKSETGHGRNETRQIKKIAISQLDAKIFDKYKDAHSLLQVIGTVQKHDKISEEVRYFICDKSLKTLSLKQLLNYVRNHWIQENGLHWVKDSILKEDGAYEKINRSSRLFGFMKDLTVSIGYSVKKSVQEFVDSFSIDPQKGLIELLMV